MRNRREMCRATPYRLLDANGIVGHYASLPHVLIRWMRENGKWYQVYRWDELIDGA